MKKLILSAALLLTASMAQAVPMLVNYQGMYVDNAGVPVTQTNTPVVISIWDDPTSTNTTNRKYQEQHSSNVSDGNFSLKIGSGSSQIGTFDAALFDTSSALYLQLNINGEDMLPRVRFLSAPYTLQSENSTKLGNQPLAYFASATDLTNLQTSLNTEITNRGTDVDTEESARIAADNSLQNQINTLSSTDTTLQNNINTANSTRASADTNLQNQINTLSNTDTTLQNNINTETSARGAADTTLQNNINSEASTRSTKDGELQTQITDEVTNRTNADTSNLAAMCKASVGSVWVSALNLCVGGSVDLSNVNLSTRSLAGVHLSAATITKTNFNSANLSNAFWRNVTYTSTTGNQPTFASANLTNATITGMSLVNIAFSTAILNGLYTNNISVCPTSLPTNWVCVTYDGTLKRLIGPNARFYSPNGELPPANWNSISFPANLTGVNFSYNRFHTCNFNASTNFTNANLRGATFVACGISAGGTVTWNNTVCPDGTNTNTNGKGTCMGQGM